MTGVSAAPSTGDPVDAGSRLGRIAPTVWLGAAVAAFFLVAFALSWWRALELQTTTWDMGLYQQALWSTAHGRAFYETADVETGGYRSLLEVHSVLVFYALAPVYGAFPSQATLLVVQSAVVALAAVPLFFLARHLGNSARLGLIAAVAFLAWTPTLSSTMYDFHPEAFLPLEVFAVVWCWQRERYLGGFAVVVVAFLTLELAPVLLFFVGLFFLLPPAPIATRFRAFVGGPTVRRREWAAVRAWLRTARARASLAMMAGCVLAYALLLVLRTDVLVATLGTTPLPQPPVGYVIGATPAGLGLALGNLGVGLEAKITYWLLLIALLGFIPLLAPRALLLAVPWVAFTFLSANLNYVQLGFQYGFLAACSLLVAFAYGLPRARDMLLTWASASHAGMSASSPPGRSHPTPYQVRRTAILVGVVALLAVNVALTPADPALQFTGAGSAYRFSYSAPTGFSNVEQLVGLIPSGATVVASDDLFPLVANDVNAYSFSWAQDPTLGLPFNSTHLPPYVLISEVRTGAVSNWLVPWLYQPVYGLRGIAWTSPAGTVLLFESGYVGPADACGGAPAPTGAFSGESLAPGPAGSVGSVNDSEAPYVVESVPGALGTVFEGPSLSMAAGSYTVNVSLRLSPIASFPAPNDTGPTLWIGATAFALPTFFSETFSLAQLETSGWDTVSFPVTLPADVTEFDIEAVLMGPYVQLTVNDVAIAPGA